MCVHWTLHCEETRPQSAPSVQVCDLLDLLGGSDEALKPSSAAGHSAPGESTNTTVTVGSDLLDLLGGVDPVPFTPGLCTSVLPHVPVEVLEMRWGDEL